MLCCRNCIDRVQADWDQVSQEYLILHLLQTDPNATPIASSKISWGDEVKDCLDKVSAERTLPVVPAQRVCAHSPCVYKNLAAQTAQTVDGCMCPCAQCFTAARTPNRADTETDLAVRIAKYKADCQAGILPTPTDDKYVGLWKDLVTVSYLCVSFSPCGVAGHNPGNTNGQTRAQHVHNRLPCSSLHGVMNWYSMLCRQ